MVVMFLFLGCMFDVTGDFRYVFYAIFVLSFFSGFLICISSFVKVDKEFSLHEKGTHLLGRSEVVKLTENNEDKMVTVIYETAVWTYSWNAYDEGFIMHPRCFASSVMYYFDEHGPVSTDNRHIIYISLTGAEMGITVRI